MTSAVHELLRFDAREMHSIIRDAECIKRHFIISLDKIAEILTAICTDGEISDRNGKGYDVRSPVYGRIEVKSRVLGTDGPYPRVSISPNKMSGAESFMAVRWTGDTQVHAAVLVPVASVRPLFEARLQASGRMAHIAWSQWVAASGAIDFTDRFRKVIG